LDRLTIPANRKPLRRIPQSSPRMMRRGLKRLSSITMLISGKFDPQMGIARAVYVLPVARMFGDRHGRRHSHQHGGVIADEGVSSQQDISHAQSASRRSRCSAR